MFRKSEAVKKHQQSLNYSTSQNYGGDIEDNLKSGKSLAESIGLSQPKQEVPVSSFSREALQAYEENEGREYFIDRSELLEKEEIIARTLQGLRQQEIWCVAKDYNIDGFFDPHDINKNLVYVNTDDVRRKM